MQGRKQPGMDLSPMEHFAIDNTVHDGSDWVLAPTVTDRLLERMASKGLIELKRDYWRLTALGYACSTHAGILYD
jgi:hypothetical protein